MHAHRGLHVIAIVFLLLFASQRTAAADSPAPPNIVLIMTDDQGYGDLGCHGNTVLKTSNLDRLHGQSVRLTNFHVDPTCSPTRSALMTGRYSSRTGVWHTIMGRSILRRDEVTLPDMLKAGGFATGIFGKWHLGDNYPYRPQERGFTEVLSCGGGGVGQTPDFWGNNYFNNTFLHNGRQQKFEGYCTDVFFNNALQFIERSKDKPFFAYIPTNAPHAPYNVADSYSKPYLDQGVPAPRAKFYGMIANIDENVGKLLAKLTELKLDERTIVVWMTDNGTAAGFDPKTGAGFNAGMRDTKGSEYDGGHRVPCFVRWPGKLPAGRDVPRLTAHIDLLPTLLDLAGLKAPEKVALDGMSLVPLLKGAGTLPERTLFVHSQRLEHPEKWRKCSVMTERWRLVNGNELYDIQTDPGQKQDVAMQQAEVVADLRKRYDAWWVDIGKRFDEYCAIGVGAAAENPTRLCCHDWHGAIAPWDQIQVQRAVKANGFWVLNVERAGKYEITLRQQPVEASFPIKATNARLKIGDLEAAKPVPGGATGVSFTVDLKPGETRLQTWLADATGDLHGAFYVDVKHLDAPADPKPKGAARMIYYSGKVQGVGFRNTAARISLKYPVTGWVKNLDDGRVQLVIEGSADAVEGFLKAVRMVWKDNITKEEITEQAVTGKFTQFVVER